MQVFFKKATIACHCPHLAKNSRNEEHIQTSTSVMESERERLKPFRRALSKEDQEAFDRLFDRAKMHTSAGIYMANPWPMDTILVSICWNTESSSRRSQVS